MFTGSIPNNSNSCRFQLRKLIAGDGKGRWKESYYTISYIHTHIIPTYPHYISYTSHQSPPCISSFLPFSILSITLANLFGHFFSWPCWTSLSSPWSQISISSVLVLCAVWQAIQGDNTGRIRGASLTDLNGLEGVAMRGQKWKAFGCTGRPAWRFSPWHRFELCTSLLDCSWPMLGETEMMMVYWWTH